MQAERHAVEHKLVLSADLIDINCRKPLLGDACHGNIEPHVALLPPVRRTVRHDQHFGAGLGQTFDDFRAPDVLADRKPQPHAAEIHRTGHRPGRKHALFVEHAVVREIDLVAQRGDHAAVEQRHRVVELAAVDPRRADQQRRATRCGFARKRFDRGAAGGLEGGLEHQILGRIAGDEQFRENDQIGALGGRLLAGTPHFLGIAGDVADRRVELRDRDGQLVSGTGVHGKALPPALPGSAMGSLASQPSKPATAVQNGPKRKLPCTKTP